MQANKHLNRKYKPLVISGCSGVGKGTLITNLLQNFPELFELSVSYTTRAPREGEIHGKHYFFVTREEFQKLKKEGDFLESCEVHKNFYGTSASQVQSIIAKGKICVLDVDVQGAEKIHSVYPNWNFLFISPPSLQELQARIIGRGTETEESLRIRLKNAEIELKRMQELGFYENLMNDKIEVCYQNFITIINNRYELLIEMEKS